MVHVSVPIPDCGNQERMGEPAFDEAATVHPRDRCVHSHVRLPIVPGFSRRRFIVLRLFSRRQPNSQILSSIGEHPQSRWGVLERQQFPNTRRICILTWPAIL